MKTLRILFVILMLLFVLDWNEILEIKSLDLKEFVYFGVIISPLVLLIIEFIFSKKQKPIWNSFLFFSFLLLIVGNPLIILFHTSPWHTQVIQFENRTFSNYRVEFQMKDIGARGYKRRKAKVFYLSKFFMVVFSKEIDLKNYPKSNWKKVNKEVNELNLKGG